MSPAERRAKAASEANQQKQANKAKQQAKNQDSEEDQRLEFDKAKFTQRKKEFASRDKEREEVNKRMNAALELKKDEAQRKRDKAKDKAESNKKARLERDKKNAEAALADRTDKMKKLEVGFDNVEKDDGLGTAFSKFGGNMTQLGQKVARGATNFAKREFPVVGQRARLRQAKRDLKDAEKSQGKQPEQKTKEQPSVVAKKEPAPAPAQKDKTTVQKVKTDQKALPPASAQKSLPPASAQKTLPPARSQKALPAARTKSLPSGERKALPAAKEKGTYVGKRYTITQGGSKGGSLAKKSDGGAGSLTRAVDNANNKRAAKRAQTTSGSDYSSKADRIAAFKKRRSADRAAGVKMREEFLQEVEKMKKEKVDKVINILKGKKNKIETMPKVNESNDWRDNYIPTEFETVDIIKPEPLKPSNWRKDIEEASAAWTRKSGKNKSGGLNEKGRKSYERENPGSDLKRPSKKVGNPRRKSFCARMKGMKKKLTSSKTARDPDSRINKSLRAWNC